VEAIPSLERLRNNVGGIVVNDPNGLCVVHRGTVLVDGNDTGVFTSLTRLARQLGPNHDGGSDTNAAAPAAAAAAAASGPLITLEYDEAASIGAASAILLKDYDGHAVAFRVPKTDAAASHETGRAAGVDGQNAANTAPTSR
jgi:hypothetical protein